MLIIVCIFMLCDFYAICRTTSRKKKRKGNVIPCDALEDGSRCVEAE